MVDPQAFEMDERRERRGQTALAPPVRRMRSLRARARATRATFREATDIVIHWRTARCGGDSAVESHTRLAFTGRRRGHRRRLGTRTDLGTQLQRKSSQMANFCFLEATAQ